VGRRAHQARRGVESPELVVLSAACTPHPPTLEDRAPKRILLGSMVTPNTNRWKSQGSAHRVLSGPDLRALLWIQGAFTGALTPPSRPVRVPSVTVVMSLGRPRGSCRSAQGHAAALKWPREKAARWPPARRSWRFDHSAREEAQSPTRSRLTRQGLHETRSSRSRRPQRREGELLPECQAWL